MTTATVAKTYNPRANIIKTSCTFLFCINILPFFANVCDTAFPHVLWGLYLCKNKCQYSFIHISKSMSPHKQLEMKTKPGMKANLNSAKIGKE